MDGRYRLAPQLELYERNEPYLRPYLTFTARPNVQSAVYSTDAEGFRISASPVGEIDTARWLQMGGGGIVLGGSWTFGVGASCDAATIPSRLAFQLGTPQLNLGICTSNTMQNLISVLPFLDAATTIVYCNNATTLLTSLQSIGLHELFGPIRFESLLAALAGAPLAGIVERVLSRGAAPAGRLEIARQGRVTADAGEAELDARLDAAMTRLTRDLGVLCRAAHAGTRVLFCHQPFSDPELRNLTSEERELHDLNAERRGAGTGLRRFVLSRWAACGDRLAGECAALGIPFLDLPARSFAGWAFLDEWHMTDHGYRQAAEMIGAALC